MKLIATSDEVFSVIGEAKRSSTCFVTNLFPDQRKLEAWIQRKQLFEISRGPVALLLRKDLDFHHILFAAAEPAALRDALRLLPHMETAVTDLIGRVTDVDKLASCFEVAGFRKHNTLQRLAWLRNPASSSAPDPAVVCAVSDDIPAILAALHGNFDRFAEQIPPLEELQTAVDQKQILVIRNGPALAGFLYFESKAQAGIVRYWFTSESNRRQGVGAKLMKTFFSQCPGAVRLMLWVITTNANAINIYSHYGFKPDGLVALVMIKQTAP